MKTLMLAMLVFTGSLLHATVEEATLLECLPTPSTEDSFYASVLQTAQGWVLKIGKPYSTFDRYSVQHPNSGVYEGGGATLRLSPNGHAHLSAHPQDSAHHTVDGQDLICRPGENP